MFLSTLFLFIIRLQALYDREEENNSSSTNVVAQELHSLLPKCTDKIIPTLFCVGFGHMGERKIIMVRQLRGDT